MTRTWITNQIEQHEQRNWTTWITNQKVKSKAKKSKKSKVLYNHNYASHKRELLLQYFLQMNEHVAIVFIVIHTLIHCDIRLVYIQFTYVK